MNQKKQGKTQRVAPAKAGFCERSARNVQTRDYQVASQPRDWRTREDKFAKVWDSDLVPMLVGNPTLQATTLLDFLQETYPSEYPDSLLRSLQRKRRHWKATEGPEKEIIFRQERVPGWQREGVGAFPSALC